MQQNDKPIGRGLLTFRRKILLSLLGVILLMAVILLAVLQRETSIQIGAAIRDALEKSRADFQELEKSWREELASLCKRYSESTRILGAFDAALEDADPSVLAEAAIYETKLAAIPGHLMLFVDPEGRIICTLLDGRLEAAMPGTMSPPQNLPQGEDSFGYVLFKDQLYATHTDPLFLFARKVGNVLLGFPLREEIVRNLADRLNGEVTLVVGSKAIVSTHGSSHEMLLDQMVASAGRNESKILALSSQTWALFSEFLNPKKPAEGSIVCAISLDSTIAPFQRIRNILILATVGTMAAAVILGIFLSRGLSAPMLELVKGTEAVAHGRYDFQLNISSGDELGVLAKSFNTMVHGLFLKEKYRDVLDKAVSPEIAEEMLKGNLFLGGENRIVTTLFADIRGFTALTEGMEPRQIIALLNDYLEGTSAAVKSQGGVVDKYIGDGIMAIFGAPAAHPDDAHRAVRAALGIQGAVRQLNESRRASGQPEIAIGIGISTGLVVAGNVGSRARLNYTVLGETVNLAARLCSTAKPGEILISASTLAAAGPVLDVQALVPVSLKGVSNPVPVWHVKGFISS